MKRILSFFLILAILLSTAACRSPVDGSTATSTAPTQSTTGTSEPEVSVPESSSPTASTPPEVENPPEVDPPEVDPPEVDPPEVDPPEVDPPEVDPPEEVDPNSLWVANCEDYINLRNYPGGTILARIPPGGVMELKRWDGKYAYVTYNGMEGTVITNYIKPADENYFATRLDTVQPTNIYTYQQLLTDIAVLQGKYPQVLTVDSIGSSEMGRDIPVLRIGNPNAEHQVLLHGAIHAREHMTTWLLMAMVDYWLDNDLFSYGDVCYHIIPMVNPDGVIISQTGVLTDEQYALYLSDFNSSYTTMTAEEYAPYWKANSNGIDLNSNFASGWGLAETYRPNPSALQYPGEAPFVAAESIALRDYTLSYSFDATISYHATGSILYYEYGTKKDVNIRSKALGTAVSEASGYTMVNSVGVNGGGYKDWAIDELEIPSLTIEIGCDVCPLAEREIYSIFARNCQVLPAIAQWLQTQ